MANDLTLTDAASDLSTLYSRPSVKAVLDRAFEAGAAFTAAEVALVEPLAHAVAMPRPADERYVRKSIGALDAALPSQNGSEDTVRLRLNAYVTMLAGCDERALTHACRRCLDELDWMPTIHQIKERMAGWVGEDAAAIVRARAVLRARRAPADDGEAGATLEADKLAAVNRYLARHGIQTRFADDGSTYMAGADGSDYVPQQEAA